MASRAANLAGAESELRRSEQLVLRMEVALQSATVAGDGHQARVRDGARHDEPGARSTPSCPHVHLRPVRPASPTGRPHGYPSWPIEPSASNANGTACAEQRERGGQRDAHIQAAGRTE